MSCLSVELTVTFDPFGIGGESPGTRRSLDLRGLAGFARWFADLLLADQLVSSSNWSIQVWEQSCATVSSWSTSQSASCYALKQDVGFKPSSVHVKLPQQQLCLPLGPRNTGEMACP